jgi:hypothetical protein
LPVSFGDASLQPAIPKIAAKLTTITKSNVRMKYVVLIRENE